MKKSILLFSLFTLIIQISRAQDELRCFTTEKYNEAVKKHPEILKARQELEDFTIQQTNNKNPLNRVASGQVYIIPIVFHIIHYYGAENISDEQVYDAVRVLNEDYRKLNPDTNIIVAPFQSIAADIEVEFRLATIDPNGNCTNGIEHIFSPLTFTADDDAKLNPWPNDQYLNIWVVHSLANSGAAAYAYYPGTAGPAEDGVIALHNYVGSIGTSSPSHSRVLTHEIGHSFNLAHVWGSTNSPGVACGDDGVMDTPETMGWATCVLNGSVCNPPILENVQNYMEYSYCDVMFTQGQKTRMRAALNSSASFRNQLWVNSNLVATGTTGGPAQVCIPEVDFIANPAACTGTSITFHDLSWKGDVTSWNWSFPGGNPSASTDSMPVVVYSTPGNYDVSLTVSNSAGSNGLIKPNYIRIGGPPTQTLPLNEDFELPLSFPGTDGWVNNPDGGATWARFTTTGFNGTACIKMNNYTNSPEEIDEWITSSFDFSNITIPTLKFYVAHAQRNASSDDKLQIFVSNNCGKTWQMRYYNNGPSLATTGIHSINFIPNANEWRQDSVGLNPFSLKPNVRLKFTNTSTAGNNIYIDQITITGTFVNVDEIEEVTTGYALYPNPTASTSKVQFKISRTSSVLLEVKEITGQLVSTVLNQNVGAGLHEFNLPDLAPGIYLVNLSIDNRNHVRKLIVTD